MGSNSLESLLATSVFYVILGTIVLGVYLMPSVLAAHRKSSRTGRVLLINVLFGWLPPAWAWALVIAITSPPANTDHDYRSRA